MIGLDKFYIDKTDFIREWWENGATATLITRPRRFGKTLNLNVAAFGFTEEEVFQAFDEAGLGKEKQGVKEWYDGFTFGSHTA